MIGDFLNVIKDIYQKCTVNVTNSGETLEAFPSTSGAKTRLSIISIPEASLRALKHVKEIRKIRIDQKRNKNVLICRKYNNLHRKFKRIFK